MTVSEVMSEAAVLSEGGTKKTRGCSVGFKDTDKGAKCAEASDLISLFPGRRDHLSSDRKVDEIRRRLRRLVNFYSQCLGFDSGSVGSDRCTKAFFFNRAENACRLQINEEAGTCPEWPQT